MGWYGGEAPWALSEEEFVRRHHTGFIPSHVYGSYQKEGGLDWFGPQERYPLLLAAMELGGSVVELRQSGKKNQYVRLDEAGEVVRDARGLAEMMTEDEIVAKGHILFDQTIVAYAAGRPVGFAANEFGAVGIWVVGPWQGRGLGGELLHRFMTANPHMRLGQMTIAGEELARSVHRRFCREHAGRGAPETVVA